MDFINFIQDNIIVLIPVLYIIGEMFRRTEKLDNKYIPIILLPFGVAFAIALCGFNVEAIIQGILVAGTTVCADQVVKQLNK